MSGEVNNRENPARLPRARRQWGVCAVSGARIVKSISRLGVTFALDEIDVVDKIMTGKTSSAFG